MKTKTNKLRWFLFSAAALFSLASSTLVAQSGRGYNLSWNIAESGGRTCVGSSFQLSGTVGQPDTVASTGGTYVQQGGFLAAFMLPSTPTLQLGRSGNTISFIWPADCTGFVLETSSHINAPVWSPLSDGALVGVNRVVTIASPPSPMFFRLHKDCPK